MNIIKSIHIRGFKKFKDLYIDFNEHLNVIVGGNEAGKSTILEAIQFLFNQSHKNEDRSVLKDLFNRELVEEFMESPSVEKLPNIVIEAEILLDNSDINNRYFYGSNCELYNKQNPRFGIRLSCCLDTDCLSIVKDSIEQGQIPYEFYLLRWETFSGRPYQTLRSPLKLLSIDTSRGQASRSFNSYNKSLFNSKYEESERSVIKHSFRSDVEKAFEDRKLAPIGTDREFGIDVKKLILENIISVKESGIPLENHGSGMENLIKTQIALEKGNNIDVLLLEEPENHLAFPTLKLMIDEISSQKDDAQIILVTHSGMISSGLNLRNVLWIADNQVKSLSNLDKNDADFFVKACDNSILQLLLANKVLLVEGMAEFILLPKLYEQEYGETLEKAGITIISCNGLSYKRYLAVAKNTDKVIAVLTDNDKSQNKLQSISTLNKEKSNYRIFTDQNLDNWTLEVSLYKKNKSFLDLLLQPKDGCEYLYKGESYEPALGKMLNNKADTAFNLLQSKEKIEIPDYIKGAFEWLRK